PARPRSPPWHPHAARTAPAPVAACPAFALGASCAGARRSASTPTSRAAAARPCSRTSIPACRADRSCPSRPPPPGPRPQRRPSGPRPGLRRSTRARPAPPGSRARGRRLGLPHVAAVQVRALVLHVRHELVAELLDEALDRSRDGVGEHADRLALH